MAVKEIIKSYIINELMEKDNAESINLGDDELLIKNSYISSLGIVKLIVFIEDEFRINIEEDLDIKNFETVNTICSFVTKRFQKANTENQ